MPINLLLYVIVNLILLLLLSLNNAILEQTVNIICVLGIATVGVGHGAIDDILHGSSKGKQRISFIIKYLVAIILFGLIWFLSAELALLIFLSTSAFHFGQAQLIGLNIKSKVLSISLYSLWGSFVIFSVFAFHKEFLLQTNNNQIVLPKLYYHIIENSEIYLAFISITITTFFIGIAVKRLVSIRLVLRELFLLFLIFCSFLILKPFVAFSLFFILIHSTQALRQEYEFCKKENIIKNAPQFLSLFLPLTAIILVIIGVLSYALMYFQYDHFIPVALIILLSCVTIPHCFVMDKFYSFRNN